MCISMRVAWLTIERLRSGRDIRLPTATMRALNSQRPRSTSNQRLVSRTILCYLLLLCVLRDVRARSVPRDDGHGDGVRVDQAQGKISEPVEEVSDFRPNDEAAKADMHQAEARRRSLTAYVERDANEEDTGEGRNEPEKEVLVADPEKVQAEAAGDEGSVAKKRRRNDVSLLGKSALQEDGEMIARDIEENVQKDEGIRRFDARVESDDVDELDQRKASHDLAENIPDSRRDTIEHEKRLVDPTERPHANTGNADANPGDEGRGTTPKSEKYKEVIDELWKELENVTNSEQTEKIDLNKETVEGMKNLSAEVNLDEMRIDVANDEVRNDFRSLESNERRQSEHIAEETTKEERIAVEDSDLNREHRYLTGKPKYKSSTVYLNAEEGNLPGRDQESIVDGQIKKLISIRDDALGSIANDGAKDSDELDEDGLLSGKSIGVDVVATDKNEEVRNQRSSDTEQIASRGNVNLDQFSVPNRIQRWRDQASMIQEQIRNRTFLQYLKEQAIEVLPDIPKFTEGQLLETLKHIASSRESPSNETYSASLNASALSENQLEIIKCAEQLTATKQRQSFVSNMAECIRGLNFLNCLRIFVWPVMLDNLPESVKENLNNLPIEINLIDLFQGDRAKAMRAESGAHRPRLLTPEYVVFNILKGTLDSKTTYDQAPVFIDLRNETFRRLLTIGQLQILQMAERLLPGEVRREYSDRMFSCVRRFEYFSCVKYFAWPMVKQYHPALPDFPDYQAWYPSVALYPEYPIVPFPSFVENTGELPEVVEADATRMRRPEATIVSILQNTLREHAEAPPSPSVVHNVDSHVALLSPEQLLSIRMAEQLLPVSYRPGFVDKTIRCIRDFNYLTCIRYSAWPTVRQFYPALPDLSGWTPDWQLPDVFGYLPELPNLPNLPDLSSFVPGLGSGGETSTTEQQSPQSGSIQVSGRFPTILLRRNNISSKASNELENKITEILMNARNSLKAAPENPSLIVSGNVIILTTINEKQVNILKLAESILPPPARAPLVTQVLSCLRTNNDFVNCTRYVIWPTVALYVPNFPEFPSSSAQQQPPMEENRQTPLKEESASHQPPAAKEQQEWNRSQNPAANPNVRIISRTKFPQSNGPVISVTGTRFVPIFTEHPESVILNILKSIQLSSPNVRDDPVVSEITNRQQIADLFNDQQENIVRITEDLLPDAARPSFIDRMIECTRKGNFLMCSQDVLWPTLSEYFPRLPSFPNFAGYPQTSDVKPTLPQNLTDTSPFSETDVKVGQHGDATVTITDTRFFPVFSENPEGVILRILKAVQYATPGVPASIPKTPEIAAYFTEQQSNIVQIVESLLPESARPVFVERMVTCVRENAFLQCTRDIAWPTVAQFFPRLPNFPNFDGYQNLPRMKLDLSSILLRNAYAEGRTPDESSSSSIPKTTKEIIEEKMESVLKELASKDSTSRSDNSYLDVHNPVISALLTAREVNIIRLTETAIPNPLRRAYATNMVECVKSNNFMSCTEHVSWPTLRQLIPNLPSFEQLFGQLPGVGQFPDLTGQLPSFPELGNFPFPTAPSLPQLPPQIAAIPDGIQSGISQLPGLPQFPTFGGINFSPVTLLADAPQEARPYDQVVQSSRASHAEQTRSQISGVSVAANTPSVDIQGTVPGYLGQPTNILIDISKEKIRLSDIEQQRGPLPESVSSNPSKKRERRRRNADEPSDYYYGTGGEVERTPPTADNMTFPNITESEFLQLLVNISRSNNASKRQSDERPKVHFVDTLNSTIRNSLTADQYEILKIVENLNEETANRGFLSRLIRCITSLSFIRCVGIFVWPIITSVPAAIGVPSLPSLPGLGGILGRSMESEVEHFFGMSTEDFEKELLTRKESVENILLDWHKKLMQDKFQTNVGFLNIKGYGNGEVGVSFNGFRKGRATKIKDNKNLPSILTIISDIMEEVLDQRPDNEKIKKDKEKRERSLDDMQEADFQFLKESDEYADIKRSINDDQIITMFLNKIKANASDLSADGDVNQFLNAEDAYNAFSVLFGTRLNDKFANRLQAFTEEHLRNANKDISADYAKQSNAEEFKVIPLKEEMSYDLERESTESQEERKREHRAKSEFKIFLDKYSDKFVRNMPTDEALDDPDNENKIKDAESIADKTTRSELRIRLPLLQEEIISRKITSTMIQLGRALKMKMGHVMPGIGFLISFLIQTALAHARAAASVAGIISNMALASAVFSMIRQNLFGSENPKIKYVYDNDKTGPGISWPHYNSHHHHSK